VPPDLSRRLVRTRRLGIVTRGGGLAGAYG